MSTLSGNGHSLSLVGRWSHRKSSIYWRALYIG